MKSPSWDIQLTKWKSYVSNVYEIGFIDLIIMKISYDLVLNKTCIVMSCIFLQDMHWSYTRILGYDSQSVNEQYMYDICI